jgi:iron complex transport system ATP-binding protein
VNTPQPLLEVCELSLKIGRRALIRNLSIKVNVGELWCILGANGVGKTMFLNTLLGLRKRDGGSIYFLGRTLEQWPTADAAHVRAFLPQTVYDAFSAPVLEIVLMGRHPHLSRWAWENDVDRDIAMAALHAVGIADLAQRDITTLSGGERQRAAIATLLAQDAPLMLLDEPVSHLDLHHQIMILQHLATMARAEDKAIVFSIHDLNLAFRFATHAVLFRENGELDQGPINEVMNASALSSAFRHPVAQMKIGQRTVFVPN